MCIVTLCYKIKLPPIQVTNTKINTDFMVRPVNFSKIFRYHVSNDKQCKFFIPIHQYVSNNLGDKMRRQMSLTCHKTACTETLTDRTRLSHCSDAGNCAWGKGSGGSTEHKMWPVSSSDTTMHLYNPRPSNLPITQTHKVWSTWLTIKADFSSPDDESPMPAPSYFLYVQYYISV